MSLKRTFAPRLQRGAAAFSVGCQHRRVAPRCLVFTRGLSAEPVLSQLARVVSAKGTGALEQFNVNHPDAAEQRRDLLRRLSAEAEKDASRKEEALAEALDALNDPHPLVRLAGIHALARVDSNSSNSSWHSVAQMCHDDDELVRVASVRAVGRMAEPGNMEALEFLEKVEKETQDRSVRCAARDAAARLRGQFGALPAPGDGQTMLE